MVLVSIRHKEFWAISPANTTAADQGAEYLYGEALPISKQVNAYLAFDRKTKKQPISPKGAKPVGATAAEATSLARFWRQIADEPESYEATRG